MVIKLNRVWFPIPKFFTSVFTNEVRSSSCPAVTVFGINKLVEKDKQEFKIKKVTMEHQQMALELIKQHYLTEHVLVQARNMDLSDDRAVDEYILRLLNQGNSVLATTENGEVAAICVGCISTPMDPRNLRNYAFYRQDPNTKDFLNFTAKLQETPNLWDIFKQKEIFEVKMLAVVPEYRRLGLATRLVETCKEEAYDRGLNVFRMDCINSYDYRIAERCMLQSILKFPLHKLRATHAPFIKRTSPYNKVVRVYAGARATPDIPDMKEIKGRQQEMESLIE